MALSLARSLENLVREDENQANLLQPDHHGGGGGGLLSSDGRRRISTCSGYSTATGEPRKRTFSKKILEPVPGPICFF